MRDPNDAPLADEAARHKLRKVLGLRDLVPMQILIVLGTSWTGTAAHQAGTHVSFWLLGALLLFLPVAVVVQYCVRIWPLEGGVYQWTKHAFGPFAGFASAWNVGAWLLLTVSAIGLQTATGVSYALGPAAAWLAESTPFIVACNLGLFALILLVNIHGLRIGRWVSHVGTASALFVAGLLTLLLFVHPAATAAHPHSAPQAPFSLALPALTLASLNLFSKIAFNGFTALEQVAVFAGETRDPARSILRSAWIAAPIIALIYILMTGAVLTYTAADQVDLVNPVAQVIATAFGAGTDTGPGIAWGMVLSRAAILAGIVAIISQAAVYVAEAGRLPMVAAWDHIVPESYRRLHPRYGTPTHSLVVIVAVAVLFGLLASSGAAANEAFQLLTTSGFVCYGINYLLMFGVPLLAGTRFSRRPDLQPGAYVRIACACGALVTLLAMIFNLVPIVDVANPWAFAGKVALAVACINGAGAAIYWRGARRAALAI
jgi:amino acid transporter